jgi:riboflavin synthase alpha subunit
MFTGIVETKGIIKKIEKDRSNKIFTIESSISSALRIDQSVSHDGVCLTVVDVKGDQHRVEVILFRDTLTQKPFVILLKKLMEAGISLLPMIDHLITSWFKKDRFV